MIPGYDEWRLAYPPEYECDEPSTHTCSFCGEAMDVEDYDSHECQEEME